MTNDVATTNSVYDAIDRMNSGTASVYSSFQGEDFKTLKAATKAVTNSQPIADHLGKKIAMKNVIIQSVEMVDEKDGTLNDVPRIIIVDADGNSFHAISGPLLRDLENIFGMLKGGPEAWPEPVEIVVTEKKGNNSYKFFSMDIV